MEFVVGQRWVSQAEPQLGLGLVTEREGRHITLQFPASEEERIYAANNAPLARVSYLPGDRLHDRQQREYTVRAVEDLNSLKYYLIDDGSGDEKILPEKDISDVIQLSSPTQRLYSGQFDRRRSFQLRVATLQHRHQHQHHATRGLIGPRTNLLSHQLYIAHEVAVRFAPRVLLADEVGLGKTIEAGLILHHQLQTGLASRALIIVPEPLLHQWLVEMMRKFNLHFSLLDAPRYEALQVAGENNPFESQQLILCSLDMLCDDENVAQQAAAGEWDLVIVDEAHHLHWSQEEVSPAYRTIENIANRCAGLLLLTATPEQLGMTSHYARLRLLDPARFHSFDTFIKEQEHFVQLNEIVVALRDDVSLTTVQQQFLQRLVDPQLIKGTIKIRPLIKQLLDQHGTGRVLFRNTRAAINGFPRRKLQAHPLPCPAQYRKRPSLYPEQQLKSDDWISCDPRIHWLEQFLKARRSDKVLLICAHCNTAEALEKYLHLNTGIRSAAFYEGLSIIERDRAAAYFSDQESGAQVLICSEIGSEGRNFQFAHQMVLFDLPTNPDLLEQRIGRLDRIGQTEDIQIHLPYLQESAQEYLFRWYHEGVDAIENSFSAGIAVYQHFNKTLQPWLDGKEKPSAEALTSLLDNTRERTDQIRLQLQQGRDQLLELNSCDNDVAAQLISDINDSERSDKLQEYIGDLCDTFGVDNDFHSEHSIVLRPTEQMLTGNFPGLKEEGITATFDREIAQRREDMEFLTWEHPIVTDSIEMVIGSEIGNTCISAISLKSLPPGTLIVECFFSLECSAPKRLQINRFLTAAPLRVLLDSNGQDLTALIQHTQLNKIGKHVKKSARPAIAKQVRSEVEKMIAIAENQAQQQVQPLLTQAQHRVDAIVGNEIQRLLQLQKLHGAIRQEEIDFFTAQQDQALAHIDGAALELQAIRLIINT